MRHLTLTSVTAHVRAVPVGLSDLRGIRDLQVGDHQVSAQVEPGAMGEFMAVLADAGIETLVSEPPTLEQLFLGHYEDGAA